MAYTDINTEDRLVQATFAEHLERELGWETVYAWNYDVSNQWHIRSQRRSRSGAYSRPAAGDPAAKPRVATSGRGRGNPQAHAA
ncbi:MAG: hypothetical protein R3C56_37800 [Pirellulaceae bacterium]